MLAVAPSAKISYKLPKSTTLGEPAILAVTLSNTTGYRITADFGVDDQTAFIYRHLRPDGTLEKVEPSLTPANRMRTSRLMLRGNSRTASVVLDEWLDLSQMGRHQIDVEYRGAVDLEGGNAASVSRLTQLWIDVKPRDVARLEKRAGDWLKVVSRLTQGSEARAASVALTSMKDPVAIPYLQMAATRTRTAIYFDALAAMNKPEARAVLEELARNPDREIKALAVRALTRAGG